MFGDLFTLLFRPGNFFAQKQNEEISLLIPAAIVGIGGVISFFTPLLQITIIHGGRNNLYMASPEGVIIFLALPFIFWFFASVLIWGICRLLSGTGSFTATLQNCGYGYLPHTLLSPVVIVNGVVLSLRTAASSMVLDSIILVLAIIPLLSLLWAGWLWTVAMEKTHMISRVRAMAGPGLVVLLYLAPLVLNIIQLWYVARALGQ